MSFIGKFLGLIIGWKFGGFFGAICGVILGHLGDKKLYELGTVNSSFFKSKITRQSLFMQTTFAVLGHLSKAKGRVTENDIQLATHLMQQMQLDETNRRLAQEAFTRGKGTDFPLRQVIREFRLGCGQRADLLRMFLHVQVQAAFADAQLEQSEKDVLYVVAEELGLSRFQFEQMLAMEFAARQFTRRGYQQQGYQNGYSYQQHSQQNYGGYQSHSGPTVEDAYQVLGVAATDDQQTVKRAYRRLMNENHPDKLVAKGLPKEMLEMAKEKTQQIQAAYDLICKTKGWK
ncbi:MAG: co-chaperone DjlA [Pasteurella oralis]|uniref:co-chaperone DjlA n=1 Tax=Pasteurella oralis TaxID=1071947 RepID=UPI000C7AFA81|nr:co-chaperone DjlA [Pasteurella oralis]MDO5054604.1 co-chaperone DjlA [Pasteurella oralis]